MHNTFSTCFDLDSYRTNTAYGDIVNQSEKEKRNPRAWKEPFSIKVGIVHLADIPGLIGTRDNPVQLCVGIKYIYIYLGLLAHLGRSRPFTIPTMPNVKDSTQYWSKQLPIVYHYALPVTAPLTVPCARIISPTSSYLQTSLQRL